MADRDHDRRLERNDPVPPTPRPGPAPASFPDPIPWIPTERRAEAPPVHGSKAGWAVAQHPAPAPRTRSTTRDTHWIEWTRTRLQPREREELLTALTPQQKAHVLEHDYVWVEGVGVLWNPPDGAPLRRARFTHGHQFQTQRARFYIDSEGSARELSDHRIDPRMPSANPPSLPGNIE